MCHSSFLLWRLGRRLVWVCSCTTLCRTACPCLKPYGCYSSRIVATIPNSTFLLNSMVKIASLIMYHSRNHMLSIMYLKNYKPQKVGFFCVGLFFFFGCLVWVFFVKTRHYKCTEKVFRFRKLYKCSASEIFLHKISLSFILSCLPWSSSLKTWNYQVHNMQSYCCKECHWSNWNNFWWSSALCLQNGLALVF